MNLQNLPTPGFLSNGYNLRQQAASAISTVEITAARTPGGLTSGANRLHTFFTACAAAVAGLRDVTVPNGGAASAKAGALKQVFITFAEGLNDKIVPAAAAFTFSPTKTVSKVEVVGTQVVLTVTADVAAGNTVTYTQPAVNRLQDPAGNEVATTAALSITVA